MIACAFRVAIALPIIRGTSGCRALSAVFKPQTFADVCDDIPMFVHLVHRSLVPPYPSSSPLSTLDRGRTYRVLSSSRNRRTARRLRGFCICPPFEIISTALRSASLPFHAPDPACRFGWSDTPYRSEFREKTLARLRI